jgi:hypothetical protein
VYTGGCEAALAISLSNRPFYVRYHPRAFALYHHPGGTWVGPGIDTLTWRGRAGT